MTYFFSSMSAFRSLTSAPLWFRQPVLLYSPTTVLTGWRGINTAGDEMHVKGQIASKTPTMIYCEAGKTYAWCACGLSGKQPFCDGSHKRSHLAIFGLKPLKWTAKVSKDHFFCNCKQTNKQPFCDGTHNTL